MIHVTDHALIRYLDRSLGLGVEMLAEIYALENDREVLAHLEQKCRIDIEAMRQQLAAKTDYLRGFGDRTRWQNGLGFVVCGQTLITVLTDKTTDRPERFKRKPKNRLSGQSRMFERHARRRRRATLEAQR